MCDVIYNTEVVLKTKVMVHQSKTYQIDFLKGMEHVQNIFMSFDKNLFYVINILI